MKKLLLLILLTAVSAFALKDTIKSSGKWSTLTWSTGSAPTSSDTVYRPSGSSYNDTMDADYEIKSFVSDSLAQGYHIRTGYTLTVNGTGPCYKDIIWFAGAPYREYGKGLTFTSEKATAIFGNFLNAHADSCVLSLVNGDSVRTTFGTGVAQTWKSLVLGETDSVYLVGFTHTFKSVSPLTCGNNCTIYGENLKFFKVGSGAIINPGTGLKFRSGNIYLCPITSGAACTVPALIGIGDVCFYLLSQATGSALTSITCQGDVSTFDLRIGALSSADNYQMLNFNGYNLTISNILRVENSTTPYPDSIVFGSGSHSIPTFITAGDVNFSGLKFYLDLGSSIITEYGSQFKVYTNMNIIPGTSELLFDWVIPAGRTFNKLTGYPGASIHQIEGPFNCHELNVSNGTILANDRMFHAYSDTTGYDDTISYLNLTAPATSGSRTDFWNDTLLIKNDLVMTTPVIDSVHPYKIKFIGAGNHYVTGSIKRIGKLMILDGGQTTFLSRIRCLSFNDSVGTMFTNGYTLRNDSLLTLSDSVRCEDSIKCARDVIINSNFRSNITGIFQIDSNLVSNLRGAGTAEKLSLGKLEIKKTGNGVTQYGAIRAASVGFISGTYAQNTGADTINADSLNISSTDSTIIIAPIVAHRKLIIDADAKVRFGTLARIISVPGDTLTIVSGGHALPRIQNKSKIIYR